MPKRVQRFGQSLAVAKDFIGLARELIVDTTEECIRVHDGATPGGFRTARADASNLQVAGVAQDGKMTATSYNDLQTAKANITTLQGNVTTISADVAALQTDVGTAQATANGKIAKIPTPTVGRLVTVAAGGELAQNGLSKDNIARIDLDTKVLFVQAAAPTGWTLDTTVNDRVLRVSNSAGGGTGGSWNITGISAAGTVLTQAQLPAGITGKVTNSIHHISAAATGVFSASNVIGSNNDGGPNGTTIDIDFNLGGSGQAHTHVVSNDGAWRPLYVDAIVCRRAANP